MELSDVYAAAGRLSGVVRRDGLARSKTFSDMAGLDLYLKCENRQKTGSFKVRGAYNKLAILKERGELTSVVASSAGNHAQGVAFAARELGVRATIVMPRSTPLAKVLATESYGARVLLYGDCYDDAYEKAREVEQSEGARFIHPFNDDDVMAGQGTLALEILEELPDADAILVPVGGGGLLAGVALAAKGVNPRVRVIGVQADTSNAVCRSFREKKLVQCDSASTIADGIAVKCPGDRSVGLILRHADGMVEVTDDDIAETILHLLERDKQVVEPAGAAALAALLTRKAGLEGKAGKVVCVLSGGNIDVGFMHKIIEKGLVGRSRQIRISVQIPDVPGSLAGFSRITAEVNANIISVQYDRMSADLQLNEVILHVACEVGGREHAQRLLDRLESEGYHVIHERGTTV